MVVLIFRPNPEKWLFTKKAEGRKPPIAKLRLRLCRPLLLASGLNNGLKNKQLDWEMPYKTSFDTTQTFGTL
jgi:hypothetical protein